ncbi:MAG: phosphoglycerate kinase, partial [Candidatus Omnitrophota bacterium]
NLQHSESLLEDQYQALEARLFCLEQLFGRAPPELSSWTLVITTDLSLTQGNVAACNITSKTVYLHPYFFELPESKQLEILYHELISHIARGITNEDEAMEDTTSFIFESLLFAKEEKLRKALGQELKNIFRAKSVLPSLNSPIAVSKCIRELIIPNIEQQWDKKIAGKKFTWHPIEWLDYASVFPSTKQFKENVKIEGEMFQSFPGKDKIKLGDLDMEALLLLDIAFTGILRESKEFFGEHNLILFSGKANLRKGLEGVVSYATKMSDEIFIRKNLYQDLDKLTYKGLVLYQAEQIINILADWFNQNYGYDFGIGLFALERGIPRAEKEPYLAALKYLSKLGADNFLSLKKALSSDRSENGSSADKVDKAIAKFGGIEEISKGEIRDILGFRNIVFGIADAAQSLDLPPTTIYGLLLARGVHFVLAPLGWKIGASIGILNKNGKEELVIILPEGATREIIAHEIRAVLIPDLTHKENLAIENNIGNTRCLSFDLQDRIKKASNKIFGGILDRRANSVEDKQSCVLIESTLRQRVGEASDILSGLYKRDSLKLRTELNRYPPCEKVFQEEILPEVKKEYADFLAGQKGRKPATVMLLTGEGGIGKTTITRYFTEFTERALQDMRREKALPDQERIVQQIIFDDYILQPTDRPIDPATGKTVESPLKKFELQRFVSDMLAFVNGQTIYKPVYDFKTRGRLKFAFNKKGDISLVIESVKIPVVIDAQTQKPYFLYEGKNQDSLLLGSNEAPVRVKVYRNLGGNIVVVIKESENIFTFDNSGGVVVSTGTNLRVLERGKLVEALEMIEPEGKVFIVEGILTLHSIELAEKCLTVYITGGFEARLLRMLVRAAGESGRKTTEQEFIEKRLNLVRTEEIPYIRPTMKNARWVVTNLTRSEAVYVAYMRGELYYPSDEVLEALNNMGINYLELIRSLQDIYRFEVFLRLGGGGGIIDETEGTSFHVFIDDCGLVIKVPRAQFLSEFKDKFADFYNQVLKKRLGGLMVPGTILNLIDLNMQRIVDGKMRRFDEVLLQNRVETLKERLSKLLVVKDIDGVKKIIDQYFRLQRALWMRGIIDVDPKFMEKYGFVLLDGVEQLVVVGVDGLRDQALLFDPTIYRKADVRPTGLSEELDAYYELKAAKMIPQTQQDFLAYFESGLSEAHMVSDISDIEISKKQMAYIVSILRRSKIQRLKLLFNFLSYGNDNPLLYWIKLYTDTVYSMGTAQYALLAAFYEKIISQPELLEIIPQTPSSLKKMLKTFSQAQSVSDAELFNIAEDLISADAVINNIQGDEKPASTFLQKIANGLTTLVITFFLATSLVFSIAQPAYATQPANSAITQNISVKNNQLFIGNSEYEIRGVTLSTVAKGQDRQNLVLNLASVGEDNIREMQQVGINTVRTYVPPQKDLLDAFAKYNIKVIVGFAHYDDRYSSGADISRGGYKDYVNQYKDHPAILAWELGNEYNMLFRQHPEWLSLADWWKELKDAVTEIHKIDPSHPVSTTLADMNLAIDIPEIVAAGVDVIGLNSYRGDNYLSAAQEVKSLTVLPMYFSEGGTDSYNTNEGKENQAEQAKAVVNIWNSIKDEQNVLGITYMSWQDEWWKAGSLNTQDVGGISLSVPYDNFSNEEYWGWINIDGEPKLVLSQMAEQWLATSIPTVESLPTPNPTSAPSVGLWQNIWDKVGAIGVAIAAILSGVVFILIKKLRKNKERKSKVNALGSMIAGSIFITAAFVTGKIIPLLVLSSFSGVILSFMGLFFFTQAILIIGAFSKHGVIRGKPYTLKEILTLGVAHVKNNELIKHLAFDVLFNSHNFCVKIVANSILRHEQAHLSGRGEIGAYLIQALNLISVAVKFLGVRTAGVFGYLFFIVKEKVFLVINSMLKRSETVAEFKIIDYSDCASVSDIAANELEGKTVFLSVDLNVGKTSKELKSEKLTRVKAVLEDIRYLLGNRAGKIILCSHNGDRKDYYKGLNEDQISDGLVDPDYTLKPIAKILTEMLRSQKLLIGSQEVIFVSSCIGQFSSSVIEQKTNGVFLLENPRFFMAETSKDKEQVKEFAKQLQDTARADIYVQAAAGALHRGSQASRGPAANFIKGQKVVGLLVEKELTGLYNLATNPKKPVLAIMQGAKLEGKLEVIKSFIINKIADRIAILGKMAIPFINNEPIAQEIGELAKQYNVELILPKKIVAARLPLDVTVEIFIDSLKKDSKKKVEIATFPTSMVPEGWLILDVDSMDVETVLSSALKGANTVIINGTAGLNENEQFAQGTNKVVDMVAEHKRNNPQVILIGLGGDGVTAVKTRLGEDSAEKLFDLLSTMGGSGLDYLTGKDLSTLSYIQRNSEVKGPNTFCYPLGVPSENQQKIENEYGKNKELVNIKVSELALSDPRFFIDNHFNILSKRLIGLEQLLGRAPPELSSWNLIITTDLNLTQGNVAACDINSKIVYLHLYFFKLTKDQQLKILYHELISHIVKKISDESLAKTDSELFFKTDLLKIANEVYKDKIFRSGETCLAHVKAVRWNLMSLALAPDRLTQIAALFHCVELNELKVILKSSLGLNSNQVKRVSELVGRMNSVIRLPYFPSNKGNFTIQNQMNMVIQLASESEVMFLVFADKLQTILTMQESENDYLYREITEIYAPLAERLGLDSLAAIFRDQVFRLSKPQIYAETKAEVEKRLGMSMEEVKIYLRSIKRKVIKKLGKLKIEAKVSVRAKSVYSIYEKINSEDTDAECLEDIDDLLGVRVVFNSEEDIWRAVGIPLLFGKPIKGQIELKRLEKTGYKGLHSGVKDNLGRSYEFQFLTEENYRRYKYGKAAHWSYKLHRETGQAFDADEVIRTGNFASDFMAVKESLSKWVFIFKQVEESGRIVMKPLRLASGSIPADFAALRDVDIFTKDYKGAVIYKKEYDLRENKLVVYPKRMYSDKYQLQPADIVDIITSPNFLLRSTKAGITIRGNSKHLRTILLLDILNSKKIPEAQELGEDILRKAGFSFSPYTKDNFWYPLARKLDLKNEAELCAALVLVNGVSLEQVQDYARYNGRRLLQNRGLNLDDQVILTKLGLVLREFSLKSVDELFIAVGSYQIQDKIVCERAFLRKIPDSISLEANKINRGSAENSIVKPTYRMQIPQEFQVKGEKEFGVNSILTNVEVTDFNLQYPEAFLNDHYRVLREFLKLLEQLLGRAPPELSSWNLVISTDLTLTQGNVAACDIESHTVYIYPYFFRLNQDKQFEILYHELISHIAKGIIDEDEALKDTDSFLADEEITRYLGISMEFYAPGLSWVVASLENNAELREQLGIVYGCSTIELKKDLFPDGEIRVVIPDKHRIEGKVICLLHDLSADDDFTQLILTIGGLRDSGVKEINCIFPGSTLHNKVLLDIIAPYVKIYTLTGMVSLPKKINLSNVEFIPYQSAITNTPLSRKREFECILFTESDPLNEKVNQGLMKFDPNHSLQFGTVKVTTLAEGNVAADISIDVKGKDCLFILSTRSAKGIMKLLVTLEKLKNEGAKDIHVLFFFFGYDRQEKNFPAVEYGPEAFTANAAKILLTLVSRYCSRIYTVNSHFIKQPRINAYRFEGVEGLEIVNLNAFSYLAKYFKEKYELGNPVLVAPDEGVASFLTLLAESLGWPLYVFKKDQLNTKEVVFIDPEGLDVKNRNVIIFDDVISGGATVTKLARILRDKYGSADIFVGTVHGKQSEESLTELMSLTDKHALPLLREVISTDTIFSQTNRVSVAEVIVEYLREHLATAEVLAEREIPSVTLILPYRLAGAGDVVFMVNTAQKLKQIYPTLPVKVIFLKNDDYVFLSKIKLISNFDNQRNIQRLGGITYINALDSKEKMEKFIGERDLVILYAIYSDEYIGSDADYFDNIGREGSMKITVHELGRELRWQNPNKAGHYLLGFNKDVLGVPPVAPNFESYVRDCRVKDQNSIFAERAKVLKKIPGYAVLNVDETIKSNWGFIYAHYTSEVARYFKAFVLARHNDTVFASCPATIFINHSQEDRAIREEIFRIANESDFSIFEYSQASGELELVSAGRESVWIVMNTVVPRKLFGQLFTLSHDLPSLITGQDNLSNILCLDALTPGRVFFWEVLIFQTLAEYDLKGVAKKTLSNEEYAIFNETLEYDRNTDYDLLAKLFSEHDSYRAIYHKLGVAVNREFSFVRRIAPVIGQWQVKINRSLPNGWANTYPYPLPVANQFQAEQYSGRDVILTDMKVSNLDLQYPEAFLNDHYQVLRKLLKLLEQLLGRAPPELSSWNLIITTDLNLTQGNVAACDINLKTVYLHPYFFELAQNQQLRILYHELISHIVKGIRDEDQAMQDTLLATSTYVVSAENFSCLTAYLVAKEIRRLQLDPQRQVVIVFATGNTMIGFLDYLSKAPGVDWSRVQAFHLDEYKGLSTDSSYSFAYFLNKNLFSKVSIPSENIHYINGAQPDLSSYMQKLHSLGGADIVLIGVGMDGHLAFNEPPFYSGFDSRIHEIEVNQSTIAANESDYPGIRSSPYAYTLGMADIFEGRHLFFFANKEKKASIVQAALTGSVSEEIPASLLQKHSNVTVVLDEAAAGFLPMECRRGRLENVLAYILPILFDKDFKVGNKRQGYITWHYLYYIIRKSIGRPEFLAEFLEAILNEYPQVRSYLDNYWAKVKVAENVKVIFGQESFKTETRTKGPEDILSQDSNLGCLVKVESQQTPFSSESLSYGVESEYIPNREETNTSGRESQDSKFSTLKAPTTDNLMQRFNCDFSYIEKVIKDGEEVRIPEELIGQLESWGFGDLVKAVLAKRSPSLRLFVVKTPSVANLFGIPRYKNAVLARDTIPVYTIPDKRGNLCCYITQSFYEFLIADLGLFGFVLDHEFYEKGTTPHRSHKQAWEDRGWLEFFVDSQTGINKFVKLYIDRLFSEGDIDGLDRFKSSTNENQRLVYRYVKTKKKELLASQDVFLTVKGQNEKLDKCRLNSAVEASGINLEVLSGKFGNEEIYVYISNPVYIKGRDCVLFFEQLKDDREVLKLIFTLGLLEDCKAKSITCVLPDNAKAWLKEVLTQFANLWLVSKGDMEKYSFRSMSKGRYTQRAFKVAKNPLAKNFNSILFMPNTEIFRQENMPECESIRIDEKGKIILPQDLNKDKNYLLICSTDATIGIIRLLEVLFTLKSKGIVPRLYFTYFSYMRQHKTYKMKKHGSFALSGNSARVILESISRFSMKIHTLNVHFSKDFGYINVKKVIPGIVASVEICNVNIFTDLAKYFKDNKGLINPVIIGADKGADIFSSDAARKNGIVYGGHMDKKRDPSKPLRLQVTMIMPDIDVRGRDIILLDDIISSGETIIKAALLLLSRGASRVFIGCVYGEFTEGINIFQDKNMLRASIKQLNISGQLSQAQLMELESKGGSFIEEVIATDIIPNPYAKVKIGNMLSLDNINQEVSNRGPSEQLKVVFEGPATIEVDEEKSQDIPILKELLNSSDVAPDDLKADVLIICGNDNIETFKEALRAYKEGKVRKILIVGGYGRLTLPLIRAALEENLSIDISDKETLIPNDSLTGLEALDGEKRLGEVVKKSEAEIIYQILSSLALKEGFVLDNNDVYLEKKSRHTKENFVLAVPIIGQIRKDLKLIGNDQLTVAYIQTPHQQFRTKGTFNSLAKEWQKLNVKGISYAIDWDIHDFKYEKLIEDIAGEMWRLVVYSAIGNLVVEYKGKTGLSAIPSNYWQMTMDLINSHPDKPALLKKLRKFAEDLKVDGLSVFTREEDLVKKLTEISGELLPLKIITFIHQAFSAVNNSSPIANHPYPLPIPEEAQRKAGQLVQLVQEYGIKDSIFTDLGITGFNLQHSESLLEDQYQALEAR